jgi:hypothetical protein
MKGGLYNLVYQVNKIRLLIKRSNQNNIMKNKIETQFSILVQKKTRNAV